MVLQGDFCRSQLNFGSQYLPRGATKASPSQGPLHTRANSCDHEIVRAQKKVSKGRPNTPPNSSVWSRTLECSVWPWPQPNVVSMIFYSCMSSHMIKYNNQRLWAFGAPWSPGFWKQSKWNFIHLKPYRTPCRLYMHLAFTYFVGSSGVVWSKLEPTQPSHQWECLKCNGRMLWVSCVK